MKLLCILAVVVETQTYMTDKNVHEIKYTHINMSKTGNLNKARELH